MNKQPPKFEEIKKRFGAYPKQMIVNEDVAKTMEFKTHTRRLHTNWKASDVLWIREPVMINAYEVSEDKFEITYVSNNQRISFDMPKKHYGKSWTRRAGRVPNGCIKEMARTFVMVVEVKKEMLHDITYEDILAEGCPYTSVEDALEVRAVGVKSRVFQWWINLWDSTAPKGKQWKDNPEVKVVVFEKLNI